MKPSLVQLCHLTPDVEAVLHERYEVTRLAPTDDPASVAGLDAGAVRAIVTGGHIGVTRDFADKLPGLEVVSINGVGFDKVDLDHAKARGIRVSNTPDVLTDDVADLAVGLTIALLRGLVPADAHVRSGAWLQGDRPTGLRLSGRRVGIYGLGRIGRAIARRFQAFGCPIAYSGRRPHDVDYLFQESIIGLAEASDILVVAASASPETHNVVDRAVLQALGPRGILVNIARGSLVDESVLIEALRSGVIAGAALDVFADEPRVPEAFFGLPNTVLAPHIGSNTVETRKAMGDLVLANLEAHFAGRPMPTALV
ncbi:MULTISPECIES: 2-hydroxyacid dehydrogenase [unclassified Aureimonas]|uniref:2-hydroxyacid dehydrogenase n=1 Tax=unclassified Aureimonas TaxID=2615206 RepID=UPI0006F7BFA6|nr:MULTISPECIES: 2-hydroxyacid dehydrogenase [unclassified Aureimonas]KQT52771.1 dihydrofolate reductase [Aureimonas sp. Leaf427]KQT80230.1 dihydrofolate reductase [Aureimonas sp. Leaf460]